MLVAIAVHVPEWLKERYQWYVQSFNIANHTLNMLAAWGAAQLVLHSDATIAAPSARAALAALAACVVFVATNHLLLGLMLHLARHHELRATGLFSFESLSTAFVLATFGVGLATFWQWSPWLVPIALGPLLVLHRALSIPQLQEEARIDPKTGLFNARHFGATLAESWLERTGSAGRCR